MAGRPRKFKLDAAYDAATDLFWEQGYEATSLDQLLSTMQLSKSSFYQTFSSKKDLFERCLSRYDEQAVADMRHRLAKARFIMNTVVEFAQSDKRIAHIFQRNMKAMRKIFAEAVTSAQSSGDINEALDPPIVADFLVTTIIGLKSQAKAGSSGKKIANIADFAVASIMKE